MTITDFPFKNNVYDPLVSGKELPMFKFALEQSQGKVVDSSFNKELTVAPSPASKASPGASPPKPGLTRAFIVREGWKHRLL